MFSLSRNLLEKKKTNKPLNPTTLFQLDLGLCSRPSPPGEGDRNQRWSDLGRVALPLSVFPFVSLFFLILAPRSECSEPPPPPPSSTTFLFTPHSPDPVLYGGDLLESLGGSSLQRFPFPFLASIDRFSGRLDLLRRWMFGGHRVWGFLPARVSVNHLTLGVDFLKLFLKSPYHIRIEWQIRFDSVVCLAGIKDLNLSAVLDISCWCCSCKLLEFGQALCHFLLLLLLLLLFAVVVIVVGVVVFFLFLYCLSALGIGSFAMTNVTFSSLL